MSSFTLTLQLDTKEQATAVNFTSFCGIYHWRALLGTVVRIPVSETTKAWLQPFRPRLEFVQQDALFWKTTQPTFSQELVNAQGQVHNYLYWSLHWNLLPPYLLGIDLVQI